MKTTPQTTPTETAKHTPGPWRVFKSHNPKPEYTTTWKLDSQTRKCMAILTVYDINSNPKWQAGNPEEMQEHAETMAEVESNAKLIAAAPDMLEACEKALARMEVLASHGYGSAPEERRLRDAIAKATH